VCAKSLLLSEDERPLGGAAFSVLTREPDLRDNSNRSHVARLPMGLDGYLAGARR